MNQRNQPRVGDVVIFKGGKHQAYPGQELPAMVTDVLDDTNVDLSIFCPHGVVAAEYAVNHAEIAQQGTSCWYERLPAAAIGTAQQPEKE